MLGTKFGAMLLATLGAFYPSHLFVFQLVMIVDVSCHWIHLHTSNVLGKTSHRNVEEEENAFVSTTLPDHSSSSCVLEMSFSIPCSIFSTLPMATHVRYCCFQFKFTTQLIHPVLSCKNID
jgi:hypothetical protein